MKLNEGLHSSDAPKVSATSKERYHDKGPGYPDLDLSHDYGNHRAEGTSEARSEIK